MANPTSDASARIFAAHPLLDPQLLTRQRTAVRFWLPVYRRLVADSSARAALLRSLTTPVTHSGHRALAPVEAYFEDTERYLDGLLRFAPPALALRLQVLPAIRHLQDLDALLHLAFGAGAPRQRYEARRKLYLTKLLFDIDHTRAVRDGRRHHVLFAQALRETLWRDLDRDRVRPQCFALAPGRGDHAEAVPTAALASSEPIWCFEPRRLRATSKGDAIDVFDYRSRFKRELDVGLGASESWRAREPATRRRPAMGPRSGSILSKMIRGGIGDAHAMPDLLGAMFVVGNRRQAYALERRLVDALGGPFRWRDRVDTLGSGEDRTRLTAASSWRYRVLKQIVDLLVSDDPESPPYHFPVEIQIYPLGSHLTTLWNGHHAAHQQYKQRQILSELLPVLFPVEIFGSHAKAGAQSPDEK